MPAKSTVLPKPIRTELIRLGFAKSDAEVPQWQATAHRTGGGYWSKSNTAIRSFRFCPRRWKGSSAVIGQTPTALALLAKNTHVTFVPRLETALIPPPSSSFVVFLKNLAPDPEVNVAKAEGGAVLGVMDFRGAPRLVDGHLTLGTFDSERGSVFISGKPSALGIMCTRSPPSDLTNDHGSRVQLVDFLRSLRRTR